MASPRGLCCLALGSPEPRDNQTLFQVAASEMDSDCAVRHSLSSKAATVFDAGLACVCHDISECGNRWLFVSQSAHAQHETLESGSFTLSGLRSRTPKRLQTKKGELGSPPFSV